MNIKIICRSQTSTEIEFDSWTDINFVLNTHSAQELSNAMCVFFVFIMK